MNTEMTFAIILAALSLIGMAVVAAISVWQCSLERREAAKHTHDLTLKIETRSEREHEQFRQLHDLHLNAAMTYALSIPIESYGQKTGQTTGRVGAYEYGTGNTGSVNGEKAKDPIRVNTDGENRFPGMDVI